MKPHHMLRSPEVRKVAIILAIVALLVGVYAWRASSSLAVPASFDQARMQGAVIAQNMVDLSGKFTSDLERVNELDRTRKFNEALSLTSDLITRNREVKEQALELSRQLQAMAVELPNIKDPTARELALTALNDRLELIRRLLIYSDDLDELLIALQNKFSGAKNMNGKVATLIKKINEEVLAINELNQRATESMDAFDKEVK